MAAIQAVHLESMELKEDPESKAMKPCEHYVKKCGRFHFTCCGTIDHCHRCHAEYRNCTRRPAEIDEIECLDCNTRQTPGTKCVNCNVLFSKNHCMICKIWTEPEITHCVHCGFCRVGREGTLKHCHNCEQCFAADDFEKHQKYQCRKQSLRHEICPICLQSIHWNQNETVSAECGHAVHYNCLNTSLRSGNYKCSLCRKSLCNMTDAWNEIRYSIAVQPMPPMKIEINDVVESPYGQFRVQGIIRGDVSGSRVSNGPSNPLDSNPGGGRALNSEASNNHHGLLSSANPVASSERQGNHRGRGQSQSVSGVLSSLTATASQLIFPRTDTRICENTMFTGFFENWGLNDGQKVRGTLRGRDVRKTPPLCNIHCNDCETDSFDVPFHYLGTECRICRGFNTQKI